MDEIELFFADPDSYGSFDDLLDNVLDNGNGTKPKSIVKVKKYEADKSNVTKKSKWKGFKIALGAILLSAALSVSAVFITQSKDKLFSDNNVETTSDISDEKRENVLNAIELIENRTGYSFDEIDDDTAVEIYTKVKPSLKKIPTSTLEHKFYKLLDQSFLEDIIISAVGEEQYETYTAVQKFDLKKLVYEMLDEENKEWIRDPARMKEIIEEKGREIGE